MNENELKQLMSLVGKGDFSHEACQKALKMDSEGMMKNLIPILRLPEMREDNNPDLPFEADGKYRAAYYGDAIQTIKLEKISYDRESLFLAEWMERLTRRKNIACFDKSLGLEYTVSEAGLIHARVVRESSKTLLQLTYHGQDWKDSSLEIWEKGAMVRKARVKENGQRLTVPISEKVSLFARKSDSPGGIEILVSEGEFLQTDWLVLIAGLCVQGKFGRILELLANEQPEIPISSGVLKRFGAFISRLGSISKSDGYVLHPIPVFRSESESATAMPDEESLADLPAVDEWSAGWKQLNQRDFSGAIQKFSSFHSSNSDEWRLPLEIYLATYLDHLNSSQSDRRDEIQNIAALWERIFNDLNPYLKQ